MASQAILIVDVQNDFCPGGALPVPEGDRVVPVLNEAVDKAVQRGALVCASRDWHPPDSRHFKPNGGPWPVHCVRHSTGAAFHPGLKLPPSTIIISKGTEPHEDGYSAFEGRDDRGRLLNDILKEAGVEELVVGGLATDYCVKSSVLDALRYGYKVKVLEDGIRGVDVQPGDSERAVAAMKEAGARFIDVNEW